MKRAIIIVLIVVILALLGVWGYLLINGSPVEVGQATDFDNIASTPSEFEQNVSDNDVAPPVVFQSALTQLTERPVAGAVFIERDEEVFVRYVERGTGHIFDVSLETGVEERVSNTTIPRTVSAVFSPSGGRVAYTIELTPYTTEVFLASIVKNDQGDGALEGQVLPNNAREATFNASGNTLYYTIPNTDGTTAYAYDVIENTATDLFQVPFREVHTLWPEEDNEPFYIYTKPAATLDGFLYQVEQGALGRVARGPGLMAERGESALMITTSEGTGLSSQAINFGSSTVDLHLSGYPEKCVFGNATSSMMWCGTQLQLTNGTHPDDWYKGSLAFADELWRMDTITGVATLIDTISTSVDEVLDTTHMTIDPTDSYLFFINKVDDGLWLYNLSE